MGTLKKLSVDLVRLSVGSGYAATKHPGPGVVTKENIKAAKEAWEQRLGFGVKMADNFNPTAKLVLGVTSVVAAVKFVLVEKKPEDEEIADYQTYMSFKEKKAEKETRQVQAVGSSLLLKQAEEPQKDV